MVLKPLHEIIKGSKYPNGPRKLIEAANQNDVSKKKHAMCVPIQHNFKRKINKYAISYYKMS